MNRSDEQLRLARQLWDALTRLKQTHTAAETIHLRPQEKLMRQGERKRAIEGVLKAFEDLEDFFLDSALGTVNPNSPERGKLK